MSNISAWTTSAGGNNAVSPDGAPEGMAPSGVNDVIRENMSAVRRWYVDAEWINHGYVWVRQSNNSFLVSITATDVFTAHRRLRMLDGGITILGEVLASSPSGANTLVTVSSSNLSSSLSSGSVGIFNPQYSSFSSSLPPLYIQGLVQVNNVADATNDIDISAGNCRDATGAQDITIAAITKQSDVAWAVGTGAGGLDTGAVGNSDYFVWAIKRADTGVCDVLFSLSATAPTMPANYTFKRLIGWFRRSAGAILAFSSLETAGGGLEMLWSAPPLDVNVAEDATANLRVISVPVGIKVQAKINVVLQSADAGGAAAYISSPDASDQAASLTVSPLYIAINTDSPTDTGGLYMQVRTDASAQIRTRALAAACTLRIATLGFEWSRR